MPPTPACGWTPTWQKTHLRDMGGVDLHARHARARPEATLVFISERRRPRVRSALECEAERVQRQARLRVTKDTSALLKLGLTVADASPTLASPAAARSAVATAAALSGSDADDDAAGTAHPIDPGQTELPRRLAAASPLPVHG